jgi:ribosomal protein S6--L-glutamate ligase
MAESLRARGCDAFVFNPADLVHNITTGRVTISDEPVTVDAIVVKKLGDQSHAGARLRLHALRALEQQCVRVFSAADVIDVAMDRYRMSMILAQAAIPIPETIAVESIDGITNAVRQLGDAVVKPVYTSKGRGMIRINVQQTDAIASLLAKGDQRYLVQRFVDAPGRDVGATVIGGCFVGAFYRVAQPGEWMTTTAQGGKYAPCDLSPRGIALAESAARAFNLDYTVVDLVEQPNDSFLCYEVSAFGGFRGLLEATGVDPSVAYAAHVMTALERR